MSLHTAIIMVQKDENNKFGSRSNRKTLVGICFTLHPSVVMDNDERSNENEKQNSFYRSYFICKTTTKKFTKP